MKLRGLLAGLLLAAMTSPAQAELRGKVHRLVNPEAPRAEWRRVPLPGAYVVVSWSITIPAPAHAVASCRYSELARSDEKGEYAMEGPNFITAWLGTASFSVYSPGLEFINFPYGGTLASTADITMARSTLTPGERLSRISGFADPGCFDVKLHDPHGLLVPYLRGVQDEATGLKVDSYVGRNQLGQIEGAVRRASGTDKPGPLRVQVLPSSGSIQSGSPPPQGR